MKLLSNAVETFMANASAIRRMYEFGFELRQKYGAENVFDFSLGNPDLPAPARVVECMKEFSQNCDQRFSFGYTSNAGAMWAREALANHLSEEQGCKIEATDVCLSCGAASAMNAVIKTILNPGEKVLTFQPYFVEYTSYVRNHFGQLTTVMSKPETFAPDVEAMEAALTPDTRAVLINSPHNPTGAIYSLEDIKAIAAVLERKSEEYGHPVYLISDEPYRFLAFDGATVPSVLANYRYAILVSSFSKNLSLAGERVGYAVVSPLLTAAEREELMAAISVCNRILGYVNAPIVGQRLMVAALGQTVDLNIYAARRNAMAKVLTEAGIEFKMPAGAFYFFPKAPGGDDKAWCDALAEECVLGVPGSAFGGPGHFRLAFCVDEDIILRSAPKFKLAVEKFMNK